jgi:S1-C subfamily serine protease
MSFGNSTVNRIAALAAALYLCVGSAVLAQDAVPAEILSHTRLIKAGDVEGTAFSIDHGGRLYLVTARHLVAGLPESNATIQIRQADEWKDYHTVRTLFPSSAEADIAVFETAEKVSQPFKVTCEPKTGGVTMGQQVWFLGFPYGGMGSRWSSGEAPFIKRGTMSAIVGTNPDAVILYIDGFNNPGFSGGPIVYWNFDTHSYAIVGVVMGYKEDTAKVLVNGVHMDTQLLVNSGILIGYSIQHALQAIDKGQEKPH